jgi:hypothetical protein
MIGGNLSSRRCEAQTLRYYSVLEQNRVSDLPIAGCEPDHLIVFLNVCPMHNENIALHRVISGGL